MAKIDVNGLTLDYEFIGDEGAPPLVLTPGGRYPRDTAGVPELGEKLAAGGYRVLLWDRPGCGASDIAFTAPSESVMNCEALVGLAHLPDDGGAHAAKRAQDGNMVDQRRPGWPRRPSLVLLR